MPNPHSCADPDVCAQTRVRSCPLVCAQTRVPLRADLLPAQAHGDLRADLRTAAWGVLPEPRPCAGAARGESSPSTAATRRSYDEQVAVKAARGRWAATPGRSEHGLGLAVDLCGGVDRFGTDAHRWMVAEAPRYGWTHPTWADAHGSLPEPWHWEYTG